MNLLIMLAGLLVSAGANQKFAYSECLNPRTHRCEFTLHGKVTGEARKPYIGWTFVGKTEIAAASDIRATNYHAAETAVSLTLPGTYDFMLTASDGESFKSSLVKIEILERAAD